jgi:hypothetical protein
MEENEMSLDESLEGSSDLIDEGVSIVEGSDQSEALAGDTGESDTVVPVESDDTASDVVVATQDAEIAAAATASGVSYEVMLAEVEKARAALAAEAEAEAVQASRESLMGELTPTAQAIQARTQLDPLDPQYLPPAAAEALWQAEWKAAHLQSQIAERDGRLAGVEKETAISKVLAEFPGTDEEAVRALADAGRGIADLQKFAARQSEKLAQAQADAVARHVAAKTGAAKTATTITRSLPTGAAIGKTMSLDEAMD